MAIKTKVKTILLFFETLHKIASFSAGYIGHPDKLLGKRFLQSGTLLNGILIQCEHLFVKFLETF
jgi:hypothetical protein